MNSQAALGQRLMQAMMLAFGMDEATILELCQHLEEEIEGSRKEASLALTPINLNDFTPVMQKVLASWQLTTFGVLQMLSTAELFWMEALGRGRIKQLRHYLEAHDPPLRFRDRKESFADRAEAVYGGFDRAPTSLLACLHVATLSEAEAWAVGLENQGWYTIGDLRGVKSGYLRKSIYDFDFSDGREAHVSLLIGWLHKHDILSS